MSAKYRSYLLRVWHEGSPARPSWRFTVTNLTDDQQRGFASVEKLVDFVKEQMAEIAACGLEVNGERRRESEE